MVDIKRLGFIVLEQEAAQNKLDVSDVNEGLNSRMDKLGTMFVKIFNVVNKEGITVPDIWSFFGSNGISGNDIKSVLKGGKFNVNVKRDSDRDIISKGLDLMSTWLESNAKEIGKTPTLINDVKDFNTQRNDLSTFIGSENVSRRAGKKLGKLQKGILKGLSDNENRKGGIDVAKIDIDKTQAIVNLVDQQSLTTVGLTYKNPNATLISPGGGAILHFNQGDLSVGADNKIKGGKALIGKTHLAIQNDKNSPITFEKLKTSADFGCETSGWMVSDVVPSLDAAGVLSYGMKFTNDTKNFNVTGVKNDGTLVSPFVAQDTKNEYTLTGGGKEFVIAEKEIPKTTPNLDQQEQPAPTPRETGTELNLKLKGDLDKLDVSTSPINNLDDAPGHKEGPVTYLQNTLKILDDSTDPRFTGKVIERDATHTDSTNFVDNDFGPRTFASVKNLQTILFGEDSPEVDGWFGIKTKTKLESFLGSSDITATPTSAGPGEANPTTKQAALDAGATQKPVAKVTEYPDNGAKLEVAADVLSFSGAMSEVKADIDSGKTALAELRNDTKKGPSFALLDDLVKNESTYNKEINGNGEESGYRTGNYTDGDKAPYIEIGKFKDGKPQTALTLDADGWEISSYDSDGKATEQTSVSSLAIEVDPEPEVG